MSEQIQPEQRARRKVDTFDALWLLEMIDDHGGITDQ